MEWLRCSCHFPNVASKPFDTTNSSISSVSSISQYPVRGKAKSLHILTANFQSLWNKKDEVEAFVLDNDSGIQAFSGEACDRTHTCPHTLKSV